MSPLGTPFRVHPMLCITLEHRSGVEGAAVFVLERRTRDDALVTDDAGLVWALMTLPPAGFTRDLAMGLLRSELGDDAEATWDTAVEHGLLGPAVLPVTLEEEPALAYHYSTRSHPFMDMSTGFDALFADNALMTRYSDEAASPSPYLDLSYVETVPLEEATDLSDAQLRADPSQSLSLIFNGAAGVRRHQRTYRDDLWGYYQSEVVFKSVPSGGSRHPTEVFAVLDSSGGGRLDLVHYNARANLLGILSPGVTSTVLSQIHPCLTAQLDRGAILVIYASMVGRAMWRYRDPRSFRAIVVDIGHMQGQMAMLAGYAGFGRLNIDDADLTTVQGLIGQSPDVLPVLACDLLVKGFGCERGRS